MTTSPVLSITDELLDELGQKAKDSRDDVFRSHGWGAFITDLDLLPSDDAYLTAANPATILALVEHIRSLTERLERAEKDAARYQWLRKSDGGPGDELRVEVVQQHSGVPLDVEIDRIIAQEGADHE